MLLESELLTHTYQCGCAALHLQHKEACRSALRFFDNLVDLFMRPGRSTLPLAEASLNSLRSLLGTHGSQLMTAIILAIAGVVQASRVRIFAPLLKQLVQVEPSLCNTWASTAIQSLPADTHKDGAVFLAAIFSAEARESDKTFTAAAEAFSEACRRKRVQVG